MIRPAREEEIEKLYVFYSDIIDQQKADKYGPCWTKDVYPSKEELKKHLQEDLFYVLETEERFAGAGCISLHEEENYLHVPWSHELKENEIAVLHLFAIHPDFRRKGLGEKLLKRIIEDNSDRVKAIHLDVVQGNEPALKLYKKAGFHSIGLHEVYYEDTGSILAELMEYEY